MKLSVLVFLLSGNEYPVYLEPPEQRGDTMGWRLKGIPDRFLKMMRPSSCRMALLLSMGIGCSNSLAQEYDDRSILRLPPPNAVRTEALESPHLKEKDRTQLFIESSQFYRSNQRFFRSNQVNSSLSVIGLGLRSENKSGRHHYLTDVDAFYVLSEQENYLNPKELYYSYNTEAMASVTAGRRLFAWSKADQEWNQGLWQPRFMWNALHPEDNGLTGVFFQHQQGPLKILALAAPFYIPEFGPTQYINDGDFVSANPWFRPPADRLILNSVDVDIEYALDSPETWEVVNHPGGALQVQWGDEKKFWLRTNYAYKPMNQIFLAGDLRLVAGEGSVGPLKVRAVPRVLYHELVTAESGYVLDSHWSVEMNLTKEFPQEDSVEDSWIYKRTTEATSLSSKLTYNSNGRLVTPLKLDFSYLRLWGGDAADGGRFHSERGFFERRYQYLHAIKASVSRSFFRIWNRPSLIQLSGLYDFEQHGAVFSTRISWLYSQRFRLQAFADIIGLVDSSPDAVNGFIGDFRANDRIGFGVTYVF